jgi:hypothetical protein
LAVHVVSWQSAQQPVANAGKSFNLARKTDQEQFGSVKGQSLKG